MDDDVLFAVLLGGGHASLPLARDLLDRFGSLRGLLSADDGALLATRGIGRRHVASLRAVVEISERFLRGALVRGETLSDPGVTRAYLRGRLGKYEREVFACLFLDNQHRVIAYEELFFGTIDAASVHPREVVKRLLACNAAAVIFAHNHPSGVAEPSQADRRITERLCRACALVDVRVLDHMVIGDAEIVSFAERGLLS